MEINQSATSDELHARAIAEDEYAERMIDGSYINRGGANRPVMSEEDRADAVTREKVKKAGLDAVAEESKDSSESGTERPMSYTLEKISETFDLMQRTEPELYDAVLDELLVSKDFRNGFPKEVDFAVISSLFRSIFGFDEFSERSDKENDGFENVGAGHLIALSEQNDELSKKSLDMIFSTGLKGIFMASHYGRLVDDYFSKEQVELARALFDAKIETHRRVMEITERNKQ